MVRVAFHEIDRTAPSLLSVQKTVVGKIRWVGIYLGRQLRKGNKETLANNTAVYALKLVEDTNKALAEGHATLWYIHPSACRLPR